MRKQKSYATFVQQTAINDRLKTLIEVTERDADGKPVACRYSPGHTDISVAAELGQGLTSANVANIRTQVYGRLHRPAAEGISSEQAEAIKVYHEALKGHVFAVAERVTKLTDAHNVTAKAANSVGAKLDGLRTTVEALVDMHNKLVDNLVMNRAIPSPAKAMRVTVAAPLNGARPQ